MEKGPGTTASGSAALVHLEVRIAEIITPIELFDLWNTAGFSSVTPRVQDLKIDSTFLNGQLSANTVKLISPMLIIL